MVDSGAWWSWFPGFSEVSILSQHANRASLLEKGTGVIRLTWRDGAQYNIEKCVAVWSAAELLCPCSVVICLQQVALRGVRARKVVEKNATQSPMIRLSYIAVPSFTWRCQRLFLEPSARKAYWAIAPFPPSYPQDDDHQNPEVPSLKQLHYMMLWRWIVAEEEVTSPLG